MKNGKKEMTTKFGGLPTNERARSIFDLIKATGVEFNGAQIFDLGCGYGDLLLLSLQSGATHAFGIDIDEQNIEICQKKLSRYAPVGCGWTFLTINVDLPANLERLSSIGYTTDIAYCISVLPYIHNRGVILDFLSDTSDEVFIEMQYYGDGPGIPEIKNDEDMFALLSQYFSSVKNIGKTYTGRSGVPHRTLWMCDNNKRIDVGSLIRSNLKLQTNNDAVLTIK